ncbi:uncharacterized protein [Polyergus mexicanus]|uniref:uncharacterized protein n=1 Tax=Polyergus mexicanus TaxID=615972 RepID=UPI0038B621F1
MKRAPSALTRLAGRAVNIRIGSIEDIRNLEIPNCLKKELRERYIEDRLYCIEEIGFAEEFVREASETRFDEPFANVAADGYLLYRNWKRRYGIPKFSWERFLEDARDTMLDRIRDVINGYNSVKVNTAFIGEFVSGDKIGVKTIVTKNYPLLPISDLREWYEKRVVDATLASLEEFQERDSGWALSRIFNLTVNVNTYNPMRAGCHAKLPREIVLKRAVINVRSNDNACFAWAVVAALYPAEKHAGRESSYPHYTTVLNLEGVKFPMSLNRITRFERINDISINVYTVRDKKEGKGGCRVVPLRLTDDKKDRHNYLLYFDDTTRRDNATHFAWIKNLSRLVGSQLSVLPTKDDKWLEFRNYSRKERLLFVVYADLECVLKKKEERRTSNTSIVQHHEVYTAGYYARCALDGVSSTYRAYRGEDCVLWFVKELHDLALRAKAILDTDAPMTDLTPDEWERFVNATRCSVCERPFESRDARVRDHCHLTGRYRDPTHSNCNLNYRDTYVIPVFFHNLSGYDAHFIIKDVANAFPGSVEVLPITKETYISFTKNVEDAWDEGWFGRRLKLRFVDSFKFLSANLEKLASYLDKSELRIARSEFSDLSDADFELLARKGVFPYEYVDDVDKLLETRLPPREAFHSSHLDPAYYYTLPGYTWDAMLKYTGVRFELLTDIDMFEKNLYKLMNNAVFGKTMENVRNHSNVRLVTRWDGRYGAEAMIAKPNFDSKSVFAEDLVVVELRKLEVKFNKPIYVDSIRAITATDNAYGMPLANKKIPGAMKDENAGAIMTEFIGLRAKMYALRVDGRSDTKRIKGVKSGVVARTITFDDYARCLRRGIEMKREQFCIRSELHEMYTVSELKIALSPHDNKRYAISGTTDTLPWGHYKIPL